MYDNCSKQEERTPRQVRGAKRQIHRLLKITSPKNRQDGQRISTSQITSVFGSNRSAPPSSFLKFLIRIRKANSRTEPLENFQEALFILLLLVGRNRSQAGCQRGCQHFCLAQENKKAALSDGFQAAFKNHLKRL